MRKILISAMSAAALLTACQASDKHIEKSAEGKTFHVYYLGGQSNMEGFGYNDDLPEGYAEKLDGVYIYNGRSVPDGEENGGAGIWAPLEPGFGFEFVTNGETNQLSNRFGPELSFAAQMKDQYPERHIAIIKYARGGSGLALGASGYGSWDPAYSEGNGRNQYDNALTTISGAYQSRDVDGDGAIDTLIPAGIIWMQGEADAYDNEAAVAAYEDNLRQMMNLLRAALRVDDLPVVIGKIKDSGDTPETRVMGFSPEIQAAQLRYTQSDDCAAFVTVTEGFEFLEDGWHYLSDNYLTLGQAFALAALSLEEECIK